MSTVSVPLGGLWGDEVEQVAVAEAAKPAAVDFFGTPAGSVAVENLPEEAPQATPAPPAPTAEAPVDTAAILPEMQSSESVALLDADAAAETKATPADPELGAEMEYQRRLADAEQEYMQASMKVNAIEEEIGDKKAELKEAKELQQALYVRLCCLRDGDLDEEEDEEEGDGTEIDEPTDTASEPCNTAATPPANEPWRSEPLRPIIEGTAGCGPKKLDAICELLPTLGHFVDLQARAGGVGIHTEMPKGVGRGLCDSLEEKVLNWLSANRDKFGEPMELTYSGITPATESPPAPQETPPAQGISTEAAGTEGTLPSRAADDSRPTGIEEIASSPASPPQDSNPLFADPGDSIHAAQIATRLETLRKRPPEEREPDFAVIAKNGSAAAACGDAAASCPYNAGPQQDSWLLGWLGKQP